MNFLALFLKEALFTPKIFAMIFFLSLFHHGPILTLTSSGSIVSTILVVAVVSCLREILSLSWPLRYSIIIAPRNHFYYCSFCLTLPMCFLSHTTKISLSLVNTGCDQDLFDSTPVCPHLYGPFQSYHALSRCANCQ